MKPFTTIAVVVFTVVSVLQLVRVVEGWEVVIASFQVPAWLSLVACAFAALLAVMAWRENRRAA
jgi:uncharacterized membrane protein